MTDTNGKPRPSGLLPPFQPGQSGNPAGAPTHKTVIRRFFEDEMARMVPAPEGADKRMPFARYVVRYLINKAFDPNPNPKLVSLHVKCLDEVMKRIDPVATKEAATAIQVVVHSEQQRQFWTTVVSNAGDRKVIPSDVIDQLDNHGREPTTD